MLRTLTRMSKRITIPQLSPTHTQCKITEFLVKQGDQVEAYQTVFVVDCSPDLLTEGFRECPEEQQSMIIESQEDGTVSKLDTEFLGKWLDIDTPIGIIDDGDEIDGDWTWQAYTHSNSKESK